MNTMSAAVAKVPGLFGAKAGDPAEDAALVAKFESYWCVFPPAFPTATRPPPPRSSPAAYVLLCLSLLTLLPPQSYGMCSSRP